MVDRESARFRAQQQRQMESIITKPRNPCEGPKFSEPIKTDKEDKSIQDILGSFSKIKNVMEPSSMNNFLGIPKEPQTPVDNKTRLLFDSPGVNFTPNGQVKSSKSGSQSTSGSSSKRDQSGSSATKSGVPYAKSGHKSKEAAKQAVKQEPQASKGRPGGSSSVSAQPAPGRGISPVPTTKGKRQKDEDVKVHIKKEKDLDPGKPLDTSSSSSSSGSSSSGSSSGSRKTAKVKPSSGASSDSNSKSLPKKGSTPVKSKSSSSKSDTKPVLNAAKKEFKRPNGVVNHHQIAHAGLDATDSSKNPETVSVKQEPCAVKEEPKDCLAGGGDELGAGLFASIAKNLFGDPPDSTTEKKPDFKKEKLMVPKLSIPPSLASFRDPSKQEVEKILNMMTENKSPLTAIQNTPIKGDASCKFHFLASTPVTKSSDNLLQVPAPVKPSVVNVKQEVKVKPSSPIRETAPPEKPVKPELADDLRISEDESDSEEPQTVKEDSGERDSPRHSREMDTSRLSDSSSGSSSGESDDDSSSGNDTDSESDASSSDHESSPPQDKPAHKSYNLHDLINKKIIEGKKSPGALNVPKQPPLSNQPAAASTAATPPTLPIKETQSFPNTNQHRSTVPGGRRGEGSGGFVLGINDLTTTLTPPEDYDKGNFGKYVDNDNRINDFNKLLTEKRTPLSKSPVRTGGSVGKQNANKRGPKKVVDKSPSVAKSKTASQTKSEVSTKESKKGAKPSKQSSKSGAETKVDVKGKSSKTTPKSDKKTPPRARTPEKKLAKKPTSKEFVSDTDSSSDSDDELERTPLSKRLNGASKPHAVLSPAHKPSARTEIKNKASSKGNRTKEKSNVVKTEREASLAKPVLDDVFMSMIDQPLGLIKEPLLSPIKNEDPEKPALTPHPQEVTYKDGIPSLVVKLNLSLINRVPGRPRQPCRTERTSPRHGCSASDTHYKNELLEFEERLPSLVKVHKRKQEDLDEEDPVKESVCKKPKSECSGKTSRNFHNEEPEHNELSSIPDSDTVLDRRRPAERRGSTNSVSSLLSSQSSCSSSRRSDREAPSSQPTKRRKKTANDSMDSSCSSSSSSSSSSSGGSTNYLNAPSNSAVLSAKGHITTWGSPPPQTEERVDRSQDSTSVSNDVTCTRNGHRSVSEEWGDVGGGADYVRNSNPHVARKNMTDRQPIGLEIEESQQFTADSYLAEGKKLKHQADAQSDKNVKALMYFDAALSFILCGNAMENDPVVPVEKAITMYSDTCDIIKFILKFKGSHLNQDALSMDKKLAVLCHRCLGLLYMKMFKMKKANGIKLAKVLGEHFRNSSKSQQAAQAPSSWSSSKYTGTPSPMSPTPSPAGSVGSVGSMGSQGSNNGDAGASLQPSSLPQVQPNKLTNGVPHIMSSPANVSVPQRIVNMMSTFIQNSSYGYYGLDYWEQADVLALENIEFFRELDCEFGLLTLHSSTLDLVHYARLGLRKLKSET